ncbi:MAG: hypothetical protein ABSE73_01455 [Planctomycetota bacterium]
MCPATQFIQVPLIPADAETPPAAVFNVAHIIVIEPRAGGGARITVTEGSNGVFYETPWSTAEVLSAVASGRAKPSELQPR